MFSSILAVLVTYFILCTGQDDQNIAENKCINDIQEVSKAARRGEIWSLQILDASSKIQSGFATGNGLNLGSFDECISVKKSIENSSDIEGKYCNFGIFINYITRPETHLMGLVQRITGNISEENTGIPLIESICVPNSCTAKDLYDIFNKTRIYREFNVDVQFEDKFCQTASTNSLGQLSYLQWFTLFLISGTIFLLISSTLYDLYLIHYGLKPLHEIMLSFSIYTNMKKLLSVKRTSDQLPCINGIRSLSMMWVVLGHKFLFSLLGPNSNYLYIYDTWLKDYPSSLITGATVSVDTFFVISGVLVMYVVLLANAKGFKISLLHFLVHRILRLSPALYMVILIHMTFFRYLSGGPIWPVTYPIIEDSCVNYWWKSALFIQNTEYGLNMCVQQTWYLAVDTQLYMIAPVFFIPIKRWPKLTILAMVALALFSCILGFQRSWDNYMDAKIVNFKDVGVFDMLYKSVLVRMHAWFIGAILGYYLFIKRGQVVKIKRILVVILWTLCICVIAMSIFCQSYFYRTEYNRVVSSLYYGFARALWSLCICWIIFACTHGYGVIINKFLSMKFFIILGRLSYSIYLVHVDILLMYTGRQRTVKEFSNIETLQEYWGDLLYIILVSVIWTLAFEAPIISIGKIFLPAEMKKKLQDISNEENKTEQHNSNSYSTNL